MAGRRIGAYRWDVAHVPVATGLIHIGTRHTACALMQASKLVAERTGVLTVMFVIMKFRGTAPTQAGLLPADGP
jgi:hypothetical protein